MTFRIENDFSVEAGDLDWWFGMHDKLKWKFARTMQSVPHSYVVRERMLDDAKYNKAFGVIRTFGEPGKFRSRTQLYLHNEARDIRYWLMSRKFFMSKILNMSTESTMYGKQDAPRTESGRFAEYDKIAAWWDYHYRDVVEYDETILWKTVHQNANLVRPSALDIGAGTGTLFDANVAPSEYATVVDPSQGMLNDLVMKYPKVGNVFSGTFEEYTERGYQPFDLVTANTGSASYLTPEEIEEAPKYATKLCLLSFYAEVPPFRTDLPPTLGEALDTASSIPGAAVMRHGSYINVIMRGQYGEHSKH